jgi:hypothetical protein
MSSWRSSWSPGGFSVGDRDYLIGERVLGPWHNIFEQKDEISEARGSEVENKMREYSRRLFQDFIENWYSAVSFGGLIHSYMANPVLGNHCMHSILSQINQTVAYPFPPVNEQYFCSFTLPSEF